MITIFLLSLTFSFIGCCVLEIVKRTIARKALGIEKMP